MAESITHSVHDHAADLQDRHVGLLALISLPHDGAHSLQAGVGAVQPGNVALQKKHSNNIHINSDGSHVVCNLRKVRLQT